MRAVYHFFQGLYKAVPLAQVKRRTTLSNSWITEPLAMRHLPSMSQHADRMLTEPKAAKSLKIQEKTLKSKD